ncbi:MAG: hypothetical protein AAGI37_12620 [Planctomycetota bacterium]
MRHKNSWATVTAVGLLLLAGCGESNYDIKRGIAEAYNETTDARLAAIDAAIADALDRPIVPEDGPDVEVTTDQPISGVVFAAKNNEPGGNARVLWLDAVETDYDSMLNEYVSFEQLTRWFIWPRMAVKYDSIAPGPPEDFEAAHQDLADTRYLLLVRTREIMPPKHQEENSYFPGAWVGQGHLYDLDTGSHLAVVLVGARNPPPIDFAGSTLDVSIVSDDPEHNVEQLTERLHKNILLFPTLFAAEHIDGVETPYELDQPPFGTARLKLKGQE